MEKINLSAAATAAITDILRNEVKTAIGGKALDFGNCSFPVTNALSADLEYLAFTDKSEEFLNGIRESAEAADIHLISDRELEEDCYFGRFHLVYTVFGFHDLPHLVDEIMRLRRLIRKGGRMVIIDFDENGFADEYIKQLKRCGFTAFSKDTFTIDGISAFILRTEK
ncbi:MAG: hypothetical protein IKP86_03630 [Anaerolineaceae bacterium]|nr:hypothetical protein [Anaerolineaceae bacterium]